LVAISIRVRLAAVGAAWVVLDVPLPGGRWGRVWCRYLYGPGEGGIPCHIVGKVVDWRKW
jgi:hypothetical protein